MENLTIYKNEQELFESERDFKALQSKTDQFLIECKKCKLKVNNLEDLTGLISNTKAEARQQYLNQIKDSDIPGTDNFKQTKEEFFKTLQTPDLSKLLQLSAFLHPRVARINLGTLSGNKLCWDQKVFDEYANGYVTKDNSEIASKLMDIAQAVEAFKHHLQEVAIEKKIDITLLSNLLPNLQKLLIEEGNKIYLYPPLVEDLKNAIK